jgi:folate-dependent phosphoribosylglycinamide formyltransferase PurN
MKVLVIIGDHPRNLGLLNKLYDQKDINVDSVVLFKRENLSPKPPNNLSIKLKKYWKLHFKKRYKTEKKYFNQKKIKIKNNIIKINNEKKFYKKSFLTLIKKKKFDACFITGIPIIKNPLLKLLPINTINLHLGLIPFYKGSITMFWPFYFLEPGMAGTTYHIIDKYVDTGEILHNSIPKLEKGDGLHDVACKAIVSAHKDLPKVINEIKKRIRNNILPKKDISLRFKGKLFLRSDWKPEMLELIYGFFKDKIVDYYLEKKINYKKPKLIKLK